MMWYLLTYKLEKTSRSMSKNQLFVMGWEIVLYDSSPAANRLQALAHVYYSYKYITT
jgi:hypothetical protein